MAYGTICTLTRSMVLSLGILMLTAVGLRSASLCLSFAPSSERHLSSLPASLDYARRAPWRALLARGLRGRRPVQPHLTPGRAHGAVVAAPAPAAGERVASRHLLPSLRPVDEQSSEPAAQRGDDAPLQGVPPQPLLPTDDPELVLAMAQEAGLLPACDAGSCLLQQLRRPLERGVVALGGRGIRRVAASKAASPLVAGEGAGLGPLSVLFINPETAGLQPSAVDSLRGKLGGPTWRTRAQVIQSL